MYSSWGAATAQWICLRLPSCRLGFESQAHHLRFYHLQYLCYISRVRRTKIKMGLAKHLKKECIEVSRKWTQLKKYTLDACRSFVRFVQNKIISFPSFSSTLSPANLMVASSGICLLLCVSSRLTRGLSHWNTSFCLFSFFSSTHFTEKCRIKLDSNWSLE